MNSLQYVHTEPSSHHQTLGRNCIRGGNFFIPSLLHKAPKGYLINIHMVLELYSHTDWIQVLIPENGTVTLLYKGQSKYSEKSNHDFSFSYDHATLDRLEAIQDISRDSQVGFAEIQELLEKDSRKFLTKLVISFLVQHYRGKGTFPENIRFRPATDDEIAQNLEWFQDTNNLDINEC